MIDRALDAMDGAHFDMAIIGGGIHGAALALESARRGVQVALIERQDFGVGSSGNSLRILHGGLRYLQSLDLIRFKESVAARRWYAQRYPQSVKPLPCLMPLYGQGARRPSVMRFALAVNDSLSAARNRDLPREVHLPAGRILDRAETIALFPSVRTEKLLGGALWYDYQMISSERILVEMLRQASALGAKVANYVEAEEYAVGQRKISGVVCRDRISGRKFAINAPIVVNCAGFASPALASRAGCQEARFAPPSVAFNVLFESPVMSSHAVAVAAPRPGALVSFICPSKHGLWAGTAHVARERRSDYPAAPSDAEVAYFVETLRRAVPSFSWLNSRIRRVYWGTLPVKSEQTVDLTVRPEILSHDAEVRGLYSVIGIKFTTAADVACKTVRMVFRSKVLPSPVGEVAHVAADISKFTDVLQDGDRAIGMNRSDLLRIIEAVAEEEAVFETDDMLLRRTNWMFTARQPQSLRLLVDEVLSRMNRSAQKISPQNHDEVS